MKRVLNIVEKDKSGFDASYWAKQSKEGRINALEHLRNQELTKDGIRQRLQRVCSIIERP